MPIHDVYEKMTEDERAVIDGAFAGVQAHLKAAGLPVRGDDRAERLVEAIARYAQECND
jgi:hypothetical protein